MSRIGKLPIPVSKGVEINIEGSNVRVKGPKGELVRDFPKGISFTLDDGRVLVARENEEKQVRALHGLSRSLLANMVEGVSTGYVRDLEISGTGYRATLAGKKLQLALGFSHPIEIDPPAGISFALETPQKVRVAGADKEVVGEVAAKIRALRIPDPYKAKGVKYAGERIRRKAGKAGKVGAKA